MGFILNENTAADPKEARDYPYFVEKERNHDKFAVTTVAIGSPVDQLSASGSYSTPANFFTPAWHLKEEDAIAACNGIPDCDE
jgi:L-lysine 6-oxidase